jgi:hypothetical protein
VISRTIRRRKQNDEGYFKRFERPLNYGTGQHLDVSFRIPLRNRRSVFFGRQAVNLDPRFHWCDDKGHAVDQFVYIRNRGGKVSVSTRTEGRVTSPTPSP